MDADANPFLNQLCVIFVAVAQRADRRVQAERGRLQPAAAEPALRGAPPPQGGLPLHQLPLSGREHPVGPRGGVLPGSGSGHLTARHHTR